MKLSVAWSETGHNLPQAGHDSPRAKNLNQLGCLPVGKRARIIQISGGDDVTMRLLEMGLTPGVEVVVAGKAPLGDPLEIEVRGYRLSIRKSEAARVEIEPF